MALGKTARQFTKPRKTYKNALRLDQIPKIETFLETLDRYNVIAKREGIRIDVGKCIEAWR